MHPRSITTALLPLAEHLRGKEGLEETIKSCDQIALRVSSGKCIPCSGCV